MNQTANVKESIGKGRHMISSWFEVFLFLAAAIFLAYNNYWLAVLLLLLIMAFMVILQNRYSRQALTGMVVIAAGVLYFMAVGDPVPLGLKARDNIELTGTITNIPTYDGEKTRFILLSDSIQAEEKKLQVSCYFKIDLQKGEKVQIHGALKLPVPPGNPGEFNYPRYLSYQHIYYLFIVKNIDEIKILSGPGIAQRSINLFNKNFAKLVNDVLPQQEAAILLGMLLGKVEDIEKGQYSDFQKTGIVHVFSVSGLHVGFLLLLCAWLTSLLKMSPQKKFFSCLFLMLVYGSLVSWPVPVRRAIIMAALGLFAHYMGREKQLLNSLGLAGCIILAAEPGALFMITFQLTFLATWGLVYLYPLIKEKLKYKNIIGDLILVSLCAQVAVIPLTAYYFNLFSPLALLSNLLTTYLSAAVVILGFFALILSGIWSWLASFFLYPAGFFIELILLLNHLVVQMPGAFIWVATPSILLIIAYYAGLLLLMNYWILSYHRKLLLPGILLIIAFLLSICLPASIYNRGLMEAVFIDVGQGDSILLKSPQGKFILLNGGGSQFYDVGTRKVLPYLHQRGIRELYMIINSHPDLDHLQGLEKVAHEMPVRYIGLPHSLLESENYDILLNTARRKNIALLGLESGQDIRVEKDWSIKVLFPEAAASEEDYNNHSLVLRVAYKGFSLLLPGDLEKEGLQTLLETRKLKPCT
ncbi:MAG: ComEC/Rec2 family competence protein, partial [Syntrophomonadaceae bacterium]|nr:ComEC/Rec2 family competence protein [Syntrophomonadaceae bacterium]